MIRQTFLTLFILFLSEEIFPQSYITKDIVIINTREVDRYRISELIEAINEQHPKVIGVNYLFGKRKEADSIFISRLSKSCPIILPINRNNDSAYFKLDNCENGSVGITGNKKVKLNIFNRCIITMENSAIHLSSSFLSILTQLSIIL